MTPQPTHSRPSRLLPAILALCLIIETCVLVHLLNTRSPNAALPASSSSAVLNPANDARIATLEAENAKLKKALAVRAGPHMGSPIDTKTVPKKITDALAASDDAAEQTKWQRLAAMKSNHDMNMGIFITEQPFDSSSTALSSAFITLFEITPEEQTALEKTLVAARTQMNDLTMKNATTRMLSDESFEIKITAFPEDGGRIYDQLHNQFRSTLGQDRYDAINTTSGRALDLTFSNFGAETRTVTLTRDKSGTVDMKDIGENDGTRRMMTSRTSDIEEAKQRLGNLSTLLPPNF